MENKDIRWLQRYDNYHRACKKLLEVTESDRFYTDLSELEREGLIQRFEYTFEIAWKVMQDLLLHKGYEFMSGPNGTLKMAFEDGIIDDESSWRRMAKARNTLTHVYSEEEAGEIVGLIWSDFAPQLKILDEKFNSYSKQKEYTENQ